MFTQKTPGYAVAKPARVAAHGPPPEAQSLYGVRFDPYTLAWSPWGDALGAFGDVATLGGFAFHPGPLAKGDPVRQPATGATGCVRSTTTGGATALEVVVDTAPGPDGAPAPAFDASPLV